jgi:hypothetical protein
VGVIVYVDVEVGQDMATGRIRRSARRGLAAAALGWLSVAALALFLAPSASAAPSATVTIGDVTPPAVSVDAGGSVTFVNGIQDKTVSVGGLVPINAVVHTDVTLQLPSGNRALQPGQSVTQTFASTTAFTITYAYRVDGATLAAVSGLVPPIKAPTPFVVNTIAPVVPNLPSVNLPQLPQVNLPLPAPGVNPVPTPGTLPGGSPTTTITTTTTTTGTYGTPPGTQYTYNTGVGAPRMSASDLGAAAAFDPSRYFVPGSSLGGADRASAGGSGGQVGSYDGASVPVFGQLAGLDGASLDESSAQDAAAQGGSTPALPAAALAAVVALAAVTAALVRTHQASRSSR